MRSLAANCSKCGLATLPSEPHASSDVCVEALRAAMIKQRLAADAMAFEISSRYFGILEQLANDPEIASVEYYCFEPKTGAKVALHSSQVVGVMTAILREYQKAGDWSPMRDLSSLYKAVGDCGRDLSGALRLLAYNVRWKRETLESHLDEIDEVLKKARLLGLYSPSEPD